MATFRAQLQANLPHLSQKEQQLAKYLLHEQKDINEMSIQSISAATKVSTATISRFGKKMGYASFQALRLALAQEGADEYSNNLFEEINDSDSLQNMAQKIFTSNIDTLKSTSSDLNDRDLNKAIELILHAETLGIFGLGASNVVALDGYHKFLRTYITLSYAADFHMQLMGMTRLTEKDTAIIISHSGTDQDAIELAKVAQEHGVPIILITGARNAPLTKYAAVVFQAIAEETQYRAEAVHALIAQISLMDTLFVLTAVKKHDSSADILEKIRETIKQTRE